MFRTSLRKISLAVTLTVWSLASPAIAQQKQCAAAAGTGRADAGAFCTGNDGSGTLVGPQRIGTVFHRGRAVPRR